VQWAPTFRVLHLQGLPEAFQQEPDHVGRHLVPSCKLQGQQSVDVFFLEGKRTLVNKELDHFQRPALGGKVQRQPPVVVRF
jgi:hypothetical protein